MKKPTPDSKNLRIIGVAKQVLTLPFVLLVWLVALPSRLIGRLRLRSDKDLRADDQLRQSRARRQLRGLPAEHVQRTSATVAGSAPHETSAS